MNRKKIVIIVLAVIAVLIAGILVKLSFSSKESTNVVIKGENFIFEVSITPDPPQEKNTDLLIKVKDSKGQPIDSAKIEISYETPSMEGMGMPGIKKTSLPENKGQGIYKAKLELPSKDMWTVRVTVSTPQGTGWGSFSLSVGQMGLTKIAEKMQTGKIETGKTATNEEVHENEITITDARRQTIGVRTGHVIKGPMSLVIRAFGNISYDETELSDVTIRIRGWITDLAVNYQGQYVKKGQMLFTLYSPELYAAQKEYVQILKRETKKAAAAVDGVTPLMRSARRRLKLWGISDQQIDEITEKKEAFEKMPFLAPMEGYVIEKNVVEGDVVEAGMKVFRIVPISKVWLKAEIYQSDIMQIKPGDTATITLPYLPGKTYTAHASMIYPYLQGNARTGQVLFKLENPVQELLLDMYANIELDINLGERLQVPESAVIYIGNGRLVFLDLGEGRLSPKKIKVGVRSNGYYEVLSGLSPGDKVVTSGNFLIAAESKILSAMQYWGAEDESKPGK